MRHPQDDTHAYVLMQTLTYWSQLCEPHADIYTGKQCWWIDWLNFLPDSRWDSVNEKVLEKRWCD